MERRSPRDATDDLGRAMYQLICSRDGITAREMARQLGVERKACNQRLYTYPFISDLCYHDDDYCWHGLIQQQTPHEGLFDFSGWYGTVTEFMAQDEGMWLDELRSGCERIGRNLNDTRGLFHSFCDCRAVMRETFTALVDFGVTSESVPDSDVTPKTDPTSRVSPSSDQAKAKANTASGKSEVPKTGDGTVSFVTVAFIALAAGICLLVARRMSA